jgi:hypothetical protein
MRRNENMIFWRLSPVAKPEPGDARVTAQAKPKALHGAPLIEAAYSTSSGGKCVSLLLDKPDAGEKKTAVFVEGMDVLPRFDLENIDVQILDGEMILTWADGSQLTILGLENPAVIGDIQPEAGEENAQQTIGNNGHGINGPDTDTAAGGLGGGDDGDTFGLSGALEYTELGFGDGAPPNNNQPDILEEAEEVVVPPPPPLVVSVFATFLAALESDPIDSGEGGLIDDPGSSISFTISLSAPSTVPVEVAFTVVPGSAVAGDPVQHEGDFSEPGVLAGTVTFAPGEVSKTITLNIVDDFTFEPGETFTLQLSNPVNAELGDSGAGLGTAVGTIIDNDPVPELFIGDASALEGDTLEFSLTLSNPSFETIVVALSTTGASATEGADFGSIDGTLVTFLPGETLASVTVTSLEDDLFEPDETFTLGAAPVSGQVVATDTGTGTIGNDDGVPVLTIGDASALEGEVLSFQLTLSNPSFETIVVALSTTGASATEGVDFGSIDGTLVTFLPGETAASVTVTSLEDDLFEPHETFTLSAAAVTGQVVATDTGTGTIGNDDTVPEIVLNVSATAVEGEALTLVFTLSNPSFELIVITVEAGEGTATEDEDFEAFSGTTITFAPGETTASLTVNTIEDGTVEGDETFSVIVGGVVVGQATITGAARAAGAASAAAISAPCSTMPAARPRSCATARRARAARRTGPRSASARPVPCSASAEPYSAGSACRRTGLAAGRPARASRGTLLRPPRRSSCSRSRYR